MFELRNTPTPVEVQLSVKLPLGIKKYYRPLNTLLLCACVGIYKHCLQSVSVILVSVKM